MRDPRVVVVGAGVAGLVAAIRLAVRGVETQVFERLPTPGGKMREARPGGSPIDVGPTVLTLRRIFDEVFEEAGASLDEAVRLRPAEVLARHAWSESERLDLYADVERSVDAIGTLAGPAEAQRYRRFCERARGVHDLLEGPFLRAERPGVLGLARAVGPGGLGGLVRMRPFESLWRALGRDFADPRLRQLFGRYATYVGSSPFRAPATLVLIAHVEQEGVWLVEGGMQRLAVALAALAERCGATVHYGRDVRAVSVSAGRVDGVLLADGQRVDADAGVANADVAAVASGRLGAAAARAVRPVRRHARSLSALTWALEARTAGFPLLRHTVFFSQDYEREFADLFDAGRLPEDPTVYVCAQDRGGDEQGEPLGAERLFCLVNAPARGDYDPFDEEELDRCEQRTFARLARCGLRIDRATSAMLRTTPSDFERLFPATGGALYGEASHGWRSAFRRPGARTGLPGLYLAGGSTHPGAGVPMAALSGRRAGEAVLSDRASIVRSRPADTPGGTSTG